MTVDTSGQHRIFLEYLKVAKNIQEFVAVYETRKLFSVITTG